MSKVILLLIPMGEILCHKALDRLGRHDILGCALLVLMTKETDVENQDSGICKEDIG